MNNSTKMVKYLGYIGVTVVVLQFFVLGAHATTGYTLDLGGIGLEGDLLDWVKYVLNLVIGLAGLVSVAILVYSGIMYIVSAGDETKVESATKGITYSIIGLIICFISVLIVNFVLEYVLQGSTP